MKTNRELLAIARKQIGNGGSKYQSYVGKGGSWCDMYVYWLFNANGCSSLLPWTGLQKTYCPASIKWCRKHLAEIPPYLAMECDVIYFDWDKNGVPNHIGIVEEKVSTAVINTIEGNTSGGIVDDKARNTYYNCGIFRPKFVPEKINLGVLEVDGDLGYDTIANLERALGLKPTGILTKKVVKVLQKKAGAKADGHWGKNTSKAVQKMTGAKVDGDFGVESVKKLQQWVNKQNAHEVPETPSNPEIEPYKGTLPELPPKTAKIAVECCYAYGTSVKKYMYKGGKPKKAYVKRLNEAWKNRSGWKYPKSRAGASCDVFVGVVLKCAGYKNAVHAMAKFVNWCKRNLTKVSKPKNGDILTRTNHIMIFVQLKGKDLFANAHYSLHGGCYPAIESRKVVGSYNNIWRPKGLSYFSKGDTFTDVKKLQKFLNWYGGYGLREDYVYGNLTEYAVKDFQKNEGLEVTGRFTEKELEIAKLIAEGKRAKMSTT